MTTVTPQMVKELREISGAGMTDCKKALDQAAGNIEQAVTILRERGLAAAAKKAAKLLIQESKMADLKRVI